MNNEAKKWVIGFLILVVGMLVVVGYLVIYVDPFFHYHGPYTDVYFYTLNNQRSQNDGITKYFEYDALITGSSMTENFKTSEMDALYGTNSIKVSYSGGRYKEINDNLRVALAYNSDLKIIVRGLDMEMFIMDKDARCEDLGQFPDYLYDDLWYNDVYYIFNRDVIFSRLFPIVCSRIIGGSPGHASFDEYSHWTGAAYGVNVLCPNGVEIPVNTEQVPLSDEDRKILLDNIRYNVTSLAEEYPDITFYYFFTPYSIIYWRDLVDNGEIDRQIEVEQLVIEEILQYDNIKLYSFNNLTDITTDLNNYRDINHYGEWINSLILLYMKDEKCLLTYDNYEEYLEEELSFYTGYDYEQLNSQEDYENDYYAAALLNYEISGTEPLEISESECANGRFTIDDISDYKYLVFYGIKNQENGWLDVYIYNDDNDVVVEFTKDGQEIDDQWHQYLIDVSGLTGTVTVVMNGGDTYSSECEDILYTIDNIILY